MADVLYPKPSMFNSGWGAIPIDNWLGKTKTMTSFIHRTVGEAPNKVRGGGLVGWLVQLLFGQCPNVGLNI